MRKLTVATHGKRDMVEITRPVAALVEESGIATGWCHLLVPHTTAALVVNENADPDVARDLLRAWEALVPEVRFTHAEGNSDAHLLATLLGSTLLLPVEDGRPVLGTWQGIFLVELDGPRRRRVEVRVEPRRDR